MTDTVPAYGAFGRYQWVLLAGPSQLPRFRAALAKAREHFHGRFYWAADSNRFVADVLWHARYRLSNHQRRQLGWAPSFVSPHIADFPG